jgi:hypothetical protein
VNVGDNKSQACHVSGSDCALCNGVSYIFIDYGAFQHKIIPHPVKDSSCSAAYHSILALYLQLRVSYFLNLIISYISGHW